MIVKTNK